MGDTMNDDIKKKAEKIKSDFIPSKDGSDFVTAVRPGKEAHQTFRVDDEGNISNMHTTYQDKDGKNRIDTD